MGMISKEKRIPKKKNAHPILPSSLTVYELLFVIYSQYKHSSQQE